MDGLWRELPGLFSYVLFAGGLMWALFRGPLAREELGSRFPRWLPVALFLALGTGVLAGIGYELFVKKTPPPCPCGLPGCPPPPACEVIHDEYMPKR
jgi:hypothetical protein